MAKKKTEGAAAPRKRSAPRKSATASAMDRSPVAEGSSTTSEEVALATAASEVAPREAQPSYDDIARAAYERYLRRGGTDGQDFDDWLAAERELRRRLER